MFDADTVALIARAPVLEGLDLAALPQRLTDAYASIVAARIRIRRTANTPPRIPEVTAQTVREMKRLVVRHVTIFGHGHGLQRAIIDESQHRKPERLIMAQH